MRHKAKPSGNHAPVFRGLSLIGGHPALDFLNTVKYRGADDPQDELVWLPDVIEWARIAGLLSVAEARKLLRQTGNTASTERICREIRSFREEVRMLFEATSLQDARYDRAIARVERAISALRPCAKIDRDSGGLTRHIEVGTVAGVKARIVAAVEELLSASADLRIKACGGSDCDWLFIDRTKAGRRRWCDTRTCGNVARVRRYRLKH